MLALILKVTHFFMKETNLPTTVLDLFLMKLHGKIVCVKFLTMSHLFFTLVNAQGVFICLRAVKI